MAEGCCEAPRQSATATSENESQRSDALGHSSHRVTCVSRKAWQTPTSSPQPPPRHLLHRSQTAVGNEAEELLRQQQQRVTLQLLRRRTSLARGDASTPNHPTPTHTSPLHLSFSSCVCVVVVGLGLHSRTASMSTRQGTFLPSSFLVMSTDEGGVGAAGMSVDKADGKAAAVDGEESDEYDDQMRHITVSDLPLPPSVCTLLFSCLHSILPSPLAA